MTGSPFKALEVGHIQKNIDPASTTQGTTQGGQIIKHHHPAYTINASVQCLTN